MTYLVELLEAAKTDYRRIYDYIAKRSAQGAERWDEAFEAALQRLARNPLEGSVAPESSRLTEEVRQVLFRTKHGLIYRAIYKIDDDHVVVLRIRGPGQRPVRQHDLTS